jgi:hypothetical protein
MTARPRLAFTVVAVVGLVLAAGLALVLSHALAGETRTKAPVSSVPAPASDSGFAAAKAPDGRRRVRPSREKSKPHRANGNRRKARTLSTPGGSAFVGIDGDESLRAAPGRKADGPGGSSGASSGTTATGNTGTSTTGTGAVRLPSSGNESGEGAEIAPTRKSAASPGPRPDAGADQRFTDPPPLVGDD